jgi:YbgC/YbaW family acyl-CoA thioester hydrolase
VVTLFLRLLFAVATARFRVRTDPLGPCRTRFRVWPTDIDVLFHVNNGVYLSMLDVARVDFLLRARVAGALRARRFYPVVAAQTIRYRRSLRLFDAFEVETRILGWDEHALVLSHNYSRDGEIVAEAVVRWVFLSRRGPKVSAAEVLELFGVRTASPELPPFVRIWNEQQRSIAGGTSRRHDAPATS